MREREIFLEARDILDLAARGRYLESACGGDARLRERVAALLGREALASSLFEEPLPERLASAIDLFLEGDAAPPTHEAAGSLPPPPALSLMPGDAGSPGTVRLLAPIGPTPYGMAYDAIDVRRGVPLRISLLDAGLARDRGARGRFLATARRLAGVRHPALPPVVAIGESPSPWLATERPPGESLSKFLDRGAGLPEGDALGCGIALAGALAAIHAAGIVDRALEPGNVLIGEGGGRTRAWLVDAGLTSAVRLPTPPDRPPSRAAFMAPEEVLGGPLDPLDHRPDLFALGCLVAALACGRSPFASPSPEATLRRVAEAAPVPDVMQGLPPALRCIVAALLRRDPAERPPSADAVEEALISCLGTARSHAARGASPGDSGAVREALAGGDGDAGSLPGVVDLPRSA